ncbi:RNA polymerase sigma factor [Streptomyces sparsogenes]|uniref:RNA polymerase sigma factor n=1 Tax=Streptomyces sparsogenes TaxID=67365 RepID=UPI00332BE3F2
MAVGDRGWASDQLIKAAQDGDADSIAAVVHSAHPQVRRFARHLCASPQDAEDAAQEALMCCTARSAHCAPRQRSPRGCSGSSECLRRVRRLTGHDQDHVLAPGPDSASSAEDEVLTRLEAERVAQAIRALPDLQRRVLIMRE